jgi:hypothetical protein
MISAPPPRAIEPGRLPSDAAKISATQYAGTALAFATTVVATRLLGPVAYGLATRAISYPPLLWSFMGAKPPAFSVRPSRDHARSRRIRARRRVRRAAAHNPRADAGELPVIATRIGGTPEVVRHGETGLLVHRDPQMIAAAIDELRRHPHLAEMLVARANRLLERDFSMDRMLAETESLLRSVVRERRRA